ncbi:MAG: enoyl-CoA hydratase/isomerase family protein [Nocardioidaceae bacterium]|nr:enoyl-CoA hydratase/isomerase family protein [Nocardioidaceae bacterium]MDQ3326402.1 enoyl-CoA hydratase-related protein [Actinomycetota bacterium]
MDDDALVHLDLADTVATVTLNSPGNRNALSRRLVAELIDRLQVAASVESVLVVVVRSSGRVFCSGADMREAVTDGMVAGARAMVALQRAIVALPVPVLVRLDGPVRAGGLGIVAAADVVVAAESATFALTEARLGLAAATISLTVQARMTPRGAALAALSGAPFGAAEAVERGLVTTVVADDAVDATVAGLIAEFVQTTRQGVRETKTLLNADLLARIDSRGEQLAAASARLFGSPEARAAMSAFLQG